MELAVRCHRCRNLPSKRVNMSLLYKESDDPVQDGLQESFALLRPRAPTVNSGRFFATLKDETGRGNHDRWLARGHD